MLADEINIHSVYSDKENDLIHTQFHSDLARIDRKRNVCGLPFSCPSVGLLHSSGAILSFCT